MAGVASARVANRRALHFVYYSTTKKTVSALTKRISSARLSIDCTQQPIMSRARKDFLRNISLRAARVEQIEKTSVT
jgi:hypothetical protein